MGCEAWRTQLEAYADGEVTSEAAREIRKHLETCANCASEALSRVQFKRTVAVAGKRYEADAQFRAKIAAKVAGKPRGTSWFWRILLVPAVLLVLLSVGVNFYTGRAKNARQRVYSELADMHVAALASGNPVDVVSTDRHTVKPWFEGKIPFTFNLPELQGTDFTLVGGRVTYLEQTPGAQLIFRLRKHEISVFIFQDRGDELVASSEPVQTLSFNIESWKDKGLRYFVVGDVGAGDIEALSKLLRAAE